MNRKTTKRFKRIVEAKQTVANQDLVIRKQAAEILFLKEILSCCQKMAADINDREIVDLIGKTLNGFRITDLRRREIVQEFKHK